LKSVKLVILYNMGNFCSFTHPEDTASPIPISPAHEEEIMDALKKLLNSPDFKMHRAGDTMGIYYRTTDNHKTCLWLDAWTTPGGVSKVVYEPLENFIERIRKASPYPFVVKIQACRGHINDFTHMYEGAFRRIYRFMHTHMLSISFVYPSEVST